MFVLTHYFTLRVVSLALHNEAMPFVRKRLSPLAAHPQGPA